ncbi:DUF397 domain-containing protein [Streptomyces sp. NPDC047123]|uniref:DUF397 domain-containing protein n=1 Tax=Streptomyces sp. NPDC047123 TaxID=3155622 RepID=UPI0033E2E23F
MASSQGLPNTRWRKSSYSGNTGGDCIECAPLHGTTWQKSSRSGSSGGECLEYAQAQCNATVLIRDSKRPEGPTLTVDAAAFTAFVRSAATHRV